MPFKKKRDRTTYLKKWNAANKDKVKASRLKRYGITLTEYNELLKRQNGGCAICGYDNDGKDLYVDHDHKTGTVRGLLCNGCNFGLGHFCDCVDRLEGAILYLLRDPKPRVEQF